MTDYRNAPRVKMYLRPTKLKDRTVTHRWTLTIDMPDQREPDEYFPIKLAAKIAARLRAYRLVEEGYKVSLYVSGSNNLFQNERTYPRAADPRKTPG